MGHSRIVKSSQLNPDTEESESTNEADNLLKTYQYQDNDEVFMTGIITKKRNVSTKKNELMCFLEIEDLSGVFEVVVFPKSYNQFRNVIMEGNTIAMQGRVSQKDDFPNNVILNYAEIIPKDNTSLEPSSRFAFLDKVEKKNNYQGAINDIPKMGASEANTKNNNTVEVKIEKKVEDKKISEFERNDSDEDTIMLKDALSPNSKLVIRVKNTEPAREIFDLTLANRGKTPVWLFIEDTKELALLSKNTQADLNPRYLKVLSEKFGINNIWLEMY